MGRLRAQPSGGSELVFMAGVALAWFLASAATVSALTPPAVPPVEPNPASPPDDPIPKDDPVPAEWAYDFEGFRMRVESIEDEAILAAMRPAIPPNADATWFREGWFYDGVFWGRGEGDSIEYAGQFYNTLVRGADRDWKRFNALDAPAEATRDVFPRGSYLFGLAGGFAWRGFTNGNIFVDDEDSDGPGVQAGINTFEPLIRFSLNRRPAFELLAVRGRPGEVVEETMRFAARAWNLLRYRPDDRWEYILAWPRSAGPAEGPEEWVYALKNLDRGTSTVTHLHLRSIPPEDAAEAYMLPRHPQHLLDVHEDVHGIQWTSFLDRSGRGPWDDGHVRYSLETMLDPATGEGRSLHALLTVMVAAIGGRIFRISPLWNLRRTT